MTIEYRELPRSDLGRIGEIDRFEEGSVLVTGMTDPDWVPIMKRAAGIVTDHGGRTCHAAIVSREIGIPCVIGTGHATDSIALHDRDDLTTLSAVADAADQAARTPVWIAPWRRRRRRTVSQPPATRM